jgi:hypothetical protein
MQVKYTNMATELAFTQSESAESSMGRAGGSSVAMARGVEDQGRAAARAAAWPSDDDEDDGGGGGVELGGHGESDANPAYTDEDRSQGGGLEEMEAEVQALNTRVSLNKHHVIVVIVLIINIMCTP